MLCIQASHGDVTLNKREVSVVIPYKELCGDTEATSREMHVTIPVSLDLTAKISNQFTPLLLSASVKMWMKL